MMNDQIPNEEVFDDGKYRIVKFKNGEHDHRKLVCNTDSICVLPFDTKDGNINSVYLNKSNDYLSGDEFSSCIVNDTNYNNDSEFSEVCSVIEKSLGLNEVDVNDLFYIGKVKHNMPFYKNYRCYGVNLDNYISNINESGLKDKGIEKIKFNKVINSGEVHDSLCLSSALLLLSYLR